MNCPSPSAPSTPRPKSAPPKTSRTFLYAATWMPPASIQEMYENEFHGAIDGFGEKSSLCSRTVARRMKKLVGSGLPLHEWNVQHVLDWLEYAGLPQHRELFKRSEVDGKTLPRLTSESLKTKVGIRSLGHRQHILEELRSLKSFIVREGMLSPSTPQPPSPTGNPDTPRSIVPSDTHNEELLAQLKSQRAQWVRDRRHLMNMLGPKLAFLKSRPEGWTTQQVCDWIDHIGLSSYRKLFLHGAINGKILTSLTVAELESEVGVQSLEHRRILLAKLRSLMDCACEDENFPDCDDAAEKKSSSTYEDFEEDDDHRHNLAKKGSPKKVSKDVANMKLDTKTFGQVQGHMRECDFNIMRCDQMIAKVKKTLGIDEPHTVEYIGAQERVEVFRENMLRAGNHDEKWWVRQYSEQEKKLERHEKRVNKQLLDEDAKRKPIPFAITENICRSGRPFRIGHL